jgi:membrane-associated phospholipid phosphatase
MDTFIYFSAVVLPIATLVAVVLYVLYRPLGFKGTFSSVGVLWKRLGDICALGVSVVFSWYSAYLLKHIFAIPRPFIQDSSIVPLFMKNDFSFPSEHAAVFFSLALSLYFIESRAGIVAFVIAFMIGIARVLAGVHSTLDILAGALLVLVVAHAVRYFIRRMQK